MKKTVLMALAGIAILLAACSGSKKPGANNGDKPLVGTYWKLVELMGKPVPDQSATGKPMYLTLDGAQTRVSASAGCNVLGGSYSLDENNRIKFGQMMSTMMACPDMEWEENLKKVLEMADSYAITGDKLQLHRARMAPLAQFVAATKPK